MYMKTFSLIRITHYGKLQLLILQRAEDLKDECEDILDGIDISQIEVNI